MSKPTAFPLDESRLPFEIPRDEPYREKIARLGQMITDRIPAKKGILTKDDPEYWGLASIVTDEMADVALKMKVRKPMTLPELVKATGKPAGELEPLGDVPPDSRAAGEYYRAILSGHDCVALLRLCKTLHAKQNSQTASRRGVNSTELRSWRMAEEMLYGEFGFALGLPPAQVRDYLREKLGG